MNQADQNLKQLRLFSVRLGVVTGVLLLFGFLLATRAFAAYEGVGIFSGSLTPPLEPGVFPEEAQLGGVGGMAVNINGAGGVAPGTVYAATFSNSTSVHVDRFEPESDGKLKFVESWQVRVVEREYERCGPILHTSCKAQPISSAGAVDVDVDQTTGNVYVYQNFIVPKTLTIAVYNPDGSKVISRFGEQAADAKGETTAESPEKLHEAAEPGAIAVDGAGDVYLFDVHFSDKFYHRLMEFKPQTPGDYEHYVYAGVSHDVGAGFSGESAFPSKPVMDSAGHIYTEDTEQILEYDPAHSVSVPVCRFVERRGGITAMTVNPDSGEVFFYSQKNKEVHRLSSCNSEGKMAELESFIVRPERGEIWGMAFDPVRRFVPSRLPGVLYAATPEPVPSLSGKGEPGQSPLGYMFAQVEENPPVVESESVSGVTGSSAVLHAQIDPKGSETHYVFQYVTDVAYKEGGESFAGAVEAPLGGAVVGSGQGALSAAVSLAGLLPDTAYDYRVIATSNCSSSEPAKICEEAGVTQSFHTFPSEAASLPDGRGYELVSPIEKHGGQVLSVNPGISSCNHECKLGDAFTHFPMMSTSDGEAIVYEGSSFSSSEGAPIENEYLARRGPSGWQTTNLTSPLLKSKGYQGYKAFDAELTQGLFEQSDPSLGTEAPAGYPDLYLQQTGTPSTTSPLLRGSPPDRPSGLGDPENLVLAYAGASADLSRLFFAANDALTPATSFAPAAVDGGVSRKNLYEWRGGELRLVNVAPGNAATTPGGGFGAANESAYERNDLSHVVSNDGSRVFWSAEAGQVYVRENGERTVEIPDHAGRFLTAAADGSSVLLSDGHLFGHLEEEPAVQEADLTAGKGGFQGIVGQSEDLSHVYFVDTEVLSEAANGQGVKAQIGGDNLYAWHEGSTVFVVTLLADDNKENIGDWALSPVQRTGEASPDGRWLAFISSARLTGYYNIGPCRVVSGKTGTREFLDAPCNEAFMYDSVTGDLICASCDRGGAPPLGRTSLTVVERAAGSQSQPRYLTDSGRLYFDSEDSLTPADTNHGVEDVYEYEPEGVGTCTHGSGCVSLISGGTGRVDSNFLAVDESGKNVFFTTRDRLVPTDKDELVDLYDAREGGGVVESAGQQKECLIETCPSPPSLPPGPVPGSFAFTGAGNIIASLPGIQTVTPRAKTPTRAQEFAKALKACKKKTKKKRAACEKTARKKYGAKASAHRAAGNRKVGR